MRVPGKELPIAAGATGAYHVTVYATDATQLREYSMDSQRDTVASMDEAVACLRRKLNYSGHHAIIAIVTEETADGFNQMQVVL